MEGGVHASHRRGTSLPGGPDGWSEGLYASAGQPSRPTPVIYLRASPARGPLATAIPADCSDSRFHESDDTALALSANIYMTALLLPDVSIDRGEPAWGMIRQAAAFWVRAQVRPGPSLCCLTVIPCQR